MRFSVCSLMSVSNNFNLTDGVDEPNIKSLDNDDESEVTQLNDGKVEVVLSDSVIDYVEYLGLQRYKSSGGTHKKRDKNSSDREIHVRGLKAEAALAIAYTEAELDDEIYEGSGDGGVDSLMKLGGSILSVDLKCSNYSPPWIKVEEGAVEHKSEKSLCDAYIASHVDGNKITFYGWLLSDEVISDVYKRESAAPYSDHMNYTREDGFREMPTPVTTQSENLTLTDLA